jgi:hypothetical protein
LLTLPLLNSCCYAHLIVARKNFLRSANVESFYYYLHDGLACSTVNGGR